MCLLIFKLCLFSFIYLNFLSTINNFYYDGLHDLVGNVAQNLMGIDRKFQSWLETLSHALFELLSPESDDEDVTPVAFSLVPVIGDDDIPW